jgi:hypothetical protein
LEETSTGRVAMKPDERKNRMRRGKINSTEEVTKCGRTRRTHRAKREHD